VLWTLKLINTAIIYNMARLFYGAIFLITIFVFAHEVQAAVPLSPLSLMASLQDYNKLTLAWYDNSDNELEFKIYRRTAYTGNWELIGSVTNNLSFTITIPPGNYDYRVWACNLEGCSPDSSTNIATVTLAQDTVLPTMPGDFTVPISGVTTSGAKLSWSSSTDDNKLSHYNIYRSAGSANFFNIVASTSGLSYEDINLMPVTNYYYQVKAEDASGNESIPTKIIDITTPSLTGANTYIRLVSPNGGECFNLASNLPIRWTGNGINTASVYYNNQKIFIGSGTAFNWYMTASVSLTGDGSIKVVAVNENGVEGVTDTNDSPFTISLDCSKVTTSALKPSVPTLFRASLVNEKRNILLTWQDNATNESEFRVFRRSLPSGQWQLLTKTSANISTYTDIDVPPGNYEYDVNACNQTACSAYSNTFPITAVATLPTPAPDKIYSQTEINDGDMVSASNSSDPDIYIVNEYGFKRLFLNPVIFSFYGHLGGFEKVKNVASTTRDTYITSGLFRNCETGDEKVYGIEVTGEDSGTLRWVNTTGQQAVIDDPDFFKKVFCINNNEFNWYQKGSAYASVKQIPLYTR